MGEARVEVRRLQLFTVGQQIREVKGVRPARYTNLLHRVLLYGNLPRPAPPQRAKPDIADLLVIGGSALDGKPGIVLRPGRSAAAFKYRFAGANQLLLEVPFRGPSAGKIAQLVIGPRGQVPGARCDLLDSDGAACLVLHARSPTQDAGR